ncbi:polyisoprenoid-binding protein YceI [Nocardia transvalensis]|uniref:Polyisoprenoid-binding protein YceI n=1 Tax=Nocardia transvalensis TaxID=37333 RepID=A0A7W9P9H0_9NOCA|nr:YceI family protein [Nocardia transvalensis]MBB5911979.1 polyisoprenoid-binding protein YceI [Nocardia transvalensis]
MTTSSDTTLKTGQWTLDTAHSSVNFTVRYLGISKVRGRFNTFQTGFEVDESGAATIEATVHLDSFDTGNAQRDEHVRSADLLDVDKRPTLHFKAVEPVRVAEDFEVTGDVTFGGVTKPITLDVEWGGVQEFQGDGKRHAGFSATGTLKRSEFDITPAFPAAMLSDKIAIELDIQLIEPES